MIDAVMEQQYFLLIRGPVEAGDSAPELKWTFDPDESAEVTREPESHQSDRAAEPASWQYFRVRSDPIRITPVHS